MIHLKNYECFLEKFNIEPSDPENLKKHKQYVNETELFIKNYRTGIVKLKQIWTGIKTENGKQVFLYDGEKMLEESKKLILTTIPGAAIKSKNPYLDELSNILRIEREIIKSQIGISEDSILQTETKSKMQEEQTPVGKKKLSETLNNINKRLNENTNKIKVLKVEMDKKKKVFEKRMLDLVKDLNISIRSIRIEESKPKK